MSMISNSGAIYFSFFISFFIYKFITSLFYHFFTVLDIEALCRYLRQTTTLQIISRSFACNVFNTFNTGQTAIQFQAEDC